jgi:hypothetical protein
VSYQGIKIYNNLPNAIKDLSGNKNRFKLALKKYRCPTTYQTWQFFNNFTTNEDIAKQLEALLTHPLHFSPTKYSCSNLVAISSLVLELLKNCQVW